MAESRPFIVGIADGIFGEHRRGRQRLPPEQVKSTRVWLQVTHGEYDAVCRGALRRGQSISEYLRGLLPELFPLQK